MSPCVSPFRPVSHRLSFVKQLLTDLVKQMSGNQFSLLSKKLSSSCSKFCVNFRGELLAYSIDPVVRNRWDMLQYEYSCCGGYNAGTGYTDWEGVQTDPQPADGAAFAPLLSPGKKLRFKRFLDSSKNTLISKWMW